MTSSAIEHAVSAGKLWSQLLEFGGYTVDPATGYTPTAGYAVSVPVFERKYAIASFRPSHVLDGLGDASRARSVLGAEQIFYAGGWHDNQSGLVYLDTSIVVKSRATAVEKARQWGQVAIYDLITDESLYVSEIASAS